MNDIKNPKTKKPMIYYYVIALLVFMLLNTFLFPSLFRRTEREVDYSTFMNQLNEGQIQQVEVQDQKIEYILKDQEDWNIYVTGNMGDPNLVDKLEAADVIYGKEIQEPMSPLLYLLISVGFPILLFVGVGQLLSRTLQKKMGGGNAMTFGKSNAKVYVEAQTGKTFADVAGEDEAKEALGEIVDFLHNPKKYEAIGAQMPKGALLVGPPGTGKTLLAKAVAGEASVPFFSISGSEFVEMFVGAGAARVRDLFRQAQEKAPCIVFIDEIDTIGKKRDSGVMGGNDEREQTLNQLLTEMDGFDGKKGVVILAATNRPETLDKALLRPGRFDRRIPVELPDLAGREAILRVHAKDKQMAPNIDYSVIARATAGASGAELANIVNEAALRAVRNNRTQVEQGDLEEAVETVIAGYQRKSAVVSEKDKKIVAYHEIGHALVAAMQKHSAPVHKITIVPRTSGALGYTMQVEEEDTLLMSKEEAIDKITTYTGGRVAEEVIFGSITSGASNDIEQATKLARAMVTRLGMSDNFGMMALETVNNQYLGGDASLACSEETAAKIDQEVCTLIAQCHDHAKEILLQNMPKLHELASYLLEKETITGEEFMEILNAPVKSQEEQE
ncbi:ATP-dependent zinc metalloprotease FtsH [Negativibacillus massiliensis]|jgi:cell division protease FtsH|uniref:ATP-dependent zinc metalloprotease FtsH n=1 Tax=Negativibacillus massiliensis TaxID=1871035 RepID=UPI000338C7A3|nr:ATP-dependent zinc metalloprotease FtsH [Negativibacillus massiliensis]MBS5138996.1 ATP-dependent zinc metalloprotease FtsH [Clostridium sp.]MCI6347300.1 ATP-dependent zinc metalloprotease FtsH [Negativibacillus massiliensis]CDA77500.1 aTP-dependent zinc metalloprotease FtsH 3 [Clostridium sp. CAG:242]